MKVITLIPLIIIFSTISGCGNNEDKSTKSSTVKDRQTLLEESVKTKYINTSDIACNYQITDDGTVLDVNPLEGEIIHGVLKEPFDIIFPKSLSVKIVKELKEKSKAGAKIQSKDFWNILSSSGQESLNDYLITKYGTLIEKDYNLKRRLTAYAFTIFTEIENYQQSIKIKATDSKLFKEYSVAFSYDIRERISLNFCNDQKIEDILVPSNLLIPSYIITNVVCKDFYEENTITFQIYKDRKFYIRLDTETLIDTIKFDSRDIEVSENKKFKRLEFEDNKYNIDIKIYKKSTRNAYYDNVTRSFIYDTIKYLNIDFKKKGHHSIDLERLDCNTIKPFTI